MNIPKEAIEKAIEGGWTISSVPYEHRPGYPFSQPYIALDPTFWQALGKSLGWKLKVNFEFEQAEKPEYIQRYDHRAGQYPEWMYNAHRFLDLVYQGKSTENYWKEILGV